MKNFGDFYVMLDVFQGEDSALSIFQPFVHDLVPTDLIFPDLVIDVGKILGVVDKNISI